VRNLEDALVAEWEKQQKMWQISGDTRGDDEPFSCSSISDGGLQNVIDGYIAKDNVSLFQLIYPKNALLIHERNSST
jgi:hypothetical protein